MGAWGTGPFDNDDAADFSAGLRDLVDAEVIGEMCSRACRAVGADEDVEIGQVCEAIAAAVTVAVAAGADSQFLATPYGPGAGVSTLLARLPTDRFRLLQSAAAAALDRAFDERNNEWYDEWQDSGELEEVRAVLEPIRRALGPA